MKRIEDAPKELQDMFAVVWEQIVCSASGISNYRDEIEHAFLKGYEAAIAERAKFDEENGLIVKDIGEL